MHLFIVRHGQSTGNITNDDVPDAELTPLGQQQAREAGIRLASEGITHVLCSPLVRALHTATEVAQACGIDTISVMPELQETRRSVHRGFGRSELLQRFPLAQFPHTIEGDGWDHGGETYESGLERGFSAIETLRSHFFDGGSAGSGEPWGVHQLSLAGAVAYPCLKAHLVHREQLQYYARSHPRARIESGRLVVPH